MRALFTSDWQADYANLDTLQVVVDEILELKKKVGFDVLVHCGDVKHAYNPVDVRVVNFVLRAFTKFKKAGLVCYVDLGNHDRVGMHVDTQNWFPVLRKAGVMAFDEPTAVELDGGRIHFLPFRTDPVLLRAEASKLALASDRARTVLVFHSDIHGNRYNVLTRSEGKITCKDLEADKYLYCVGGHIHLPQRIAENVYYVGSPFAGEWGEANQKKGYLLVDFATKKLTRLLSKIPGWYDPAWPRFEESKPASWAGTRVRIKVPVADSRHVAEELRRAKEKAEAEYKGAGLVVIPVFEVGSREVSGGRIRTDWPDKKKIEKYVEETFPENLKGKKEKVTQYLIEQLSQAGGLMREGGALEFRRVVAENFLSFRKIDWHIEPGMYVVTGKNKDWGRSNGAGKTSFLQPIAVSLFGTTFKGQKHDKWVRRDAEKKDKAFVGLTFRDSQQRDVTVMRRRQPKPSLALKVNKEFVDSGNRPEQTQRSIEQITGYTWETLSNAVYIDQTRAHLMLTGTETQRKEFLAKLQNLERFERARKLVNGNRFEVEGELETLEAMERDSNIEAASLLSSIRMMKKTENITYDVEGAKKKLKDAKLAWKAYEEEARRNDKELLAKIDRITERAAEENGRRGKIEGARGTALERLEGYRELGGGNCPTCDQPVPKEVIERHTIVLKKELKKLDVELVVIKEKIDKYRRIRQKAADALTQWDEENKLRAKVDEAVEELAEAEASEKLVARITSQMADMRQRMADAQAKAVGAKNKADKKRDWLDALDYAEKVFSRSGLPAYLNAQIVPELNQAADEYAELFAHKEIQVRFAVDEEGSMDVQVVNAHGGENVQDQSEGEMKMASLITSFAVRQAAPKTNLLILDEPGDGLDPVSARQFATGLLGVLKNFSTIILTSHNPAILSELSGQKMITIVKENGISKIAESV